MPIRGINKRSYISIAVVLLFSMLILCAMFFVVGRYSGNREARESRATHEYQFDITQDSIKLYDGIRYVGTVPHGHKCPLDSLILKDNE